MVGADGTIEIPMLGSMKASGMKPSDLEKLLTAKDNLYFAGMMVQQGHAGGEVAGATSTTLTLAAITPALAGTYDVVVTNSVASVVAVGAFVISAIALLASGVAAVTAPSIVSDSPSTWMSRLSRPTPGRSASSVMPAGSRPQACATSAMRCRTACRLSEMLIIMP